MRTLWLFGLLVMCLVLVLPGCSQSQALMRSQEMQIAGLRQYKAEMGEYHLLLMDRMRSDKEREINQAFMLSLEQSADDAGKVTLSIVAEKVDKVQALRDEMDIELIRFDGEFQQRQALADRTIKVGEATLSVMEEYGALWNLLRQSLWEPQENTSAAAGVISTPPS